MGNTIRKVSLSVWVVLAIVFLFLLPSFGKVLSFIVDYSWFKEVGFLSVFVKQFITKIILGGITGIVAFIVIYGNITTASIIGKKSPLSNSIDSEFVQLNTVFPFFKFLFFGISAFFAITIGSWGGSQWENYLKFSNAGSFNIQDPLLAKDIGFYIFSLPFYRYLYAFFTAIIILAFLGSLIVYILNQNILLDRGKTKIAASAKKHLLLLGGFIALSFFFYYQLKIYSLVTTGSNIVTGAGYSDIRISLPVLKFMRFVCILTAGFIWVGIGTKTLKPAIIGIVILFASGFIGKSAKELVQKFIVSPNEIVKETPYIKWSINSTREAYKLNNIEQRNFYPNDSLTYNDIKTNSLTIKNVRLWDHSALLTTYSQLQEIRTYYEFLDVDNDRYEIDGELRQVMLSPRELVSSSLPSRMWINEHLTYTHGYGVCLGPVNKITPEGLPEFFIKDIPPVSNKSIKIKEPRIYFGEAVTSYAIVNTKAKEFDYPAGQGNAYTTYKGSGGIILNSFAKKLLFAAYFKEFKMLLSSDITSKSRILFNRQIMQRVRKIVPFLYYDRDPYLVITDSGKLVWIIDAYTVSSNYPYSVQVGKFGNYIRNSAKIVIDAYDGSISFYNSDALDPIINTFSKIFPNVFKPISKMPKDIRKHIRYPQTMFTVQANVYSIFHMTDPQVFYNKEDLWKIPEQFSNGQVKTMEPYYTIMKLPEVGKREEFILMVPFSPAKKENMISWMAARCDGEDYGKLLVFNFPKQKLVYGPKQIESRIDQHPEISQQLTLWNQGGSRVIRGSLLVIPINQSIIYIEPLYIAAEDGGGLPELKRVIVESGNKIVMEKNLEDALYKLFIDKSEAKALSYNSTGNISKTTEIVSTAQLISKANSRYTKALKALKNGKWSSYGESIEKLGAILKELQKVVHE